MPRCVQEGLHMFFYNFWGNLRQLTEYLLPVKTATATSCWGARPCIEMARKPMPCDSFVFFLRFLGYRCLRKKRPSRKKDVSPAPFYPKTMLAFCPGRSNGKACARHAHVALSWKCKWLQNKRPSANIPTLMWGLGGRARRIHM